MEFSHVSVLLEETIRELDIKPDGIYVDGTLGGAGHAIEVCKRLGASGKFVGIDQDEVAIEVGRERLAMFGDKVKVVRSNYSNLWNVKNNESLSQNVVNGLQEFGILLFKADKSGDYSVKVSNISYWIYNSEELKDVK